MAQAQAIDYDVLKDFTYQHTDGSTIDFAAGEIFVADPGEDVSQLVADGKLALSPPPAPPTPATPFAKTQLFYCLEHNHRGSGPNGVANLVSKERFFEAPADLKGAPFCDKCTDEEGNAKQVAALSSTSRDVFPEHIQILAQRA